jgi:uroporphyrinogen decarboxylase
MHPVCGHEYMLMGMALDPDWIKDMVMTYANLTIMHLEALFADEGKPDGMYFYEDLGFKERPFMSPAMYEDILEPGHKLLFDWCHSQDLKVILHSCGYVEALVPGMIRAGIDCLQAMEVKAGMDVRKLFDTHADTIAYFGNMDIREICSNDRSRIDAELQAKLPYVLDQGGRYILMSDHSVPPDADFASVQYFFETGRAMSRESFARRQA